jgi:porin
MMRTSVIVSVTFAGLLSCWMLPTARAQDAPAASNNNQGPGLTSDVQDPVVELRIIRQKREIRTPSLFPTSPLTPLRNASHRLENRVYEATDIKFGTAFNTLLQQLGDAIPGEDTFGMATFMSFVGTWDGWNKGCPNQGEVTFGLEARWDWGTTPPTDLGNLGLGSLGFTANPFNAYTPTFLVRNLFWRQGSREAGYMYRVGRVTPDQFLNTSRHINPLGTYLPIAGTGAFAMGLPDSGLGMFAGLFVNDRVNLAAVVSDANADRFDFGDIDEGDLFTAIELQVKVLPLTEKAGYSKVTLWHNDGTKYGNAMNGSTGKEGWGIFIKYEQELTCDGRAIAIARWGRSYNDSALYEQQAAAHFLLYDPSNSGNYEDDLYNGDVLGVAYNWVQPSAVPRDESNVELFYRFPLFPDLDMTLSYQAVINPALDPTNDYGSAFSLRFRSLW